MKRHQSVDGDMQSLELVSSREEYECGRALSLIERALEGVMPSTVVGTVTDVGSIMVSLSIAIVECKDAIKEVTPTNTRRSMFNNPAMATAAAAAAAATVNVTAPGATTPITARANPAVVAWGAATASHGHGLVQGAAPKELICKVIPIDAAFTTSMVVPVNLPTIAMIDKESAEEFAANLCSKFYLEIPHDWDLSRTPELHMEEVV